MTKTQHGKTKTREYNSWKAMKARCYNSNSDMYYLYGGRGITVCERWKTSFENFLNDMGPAPDGYTLDRIDYNGNYEPINCRWATVLEQANNTRFNHILTHNGKSQSIGNWSRELNISKDVLYNRVCMGWSDEKTISTPATSRQERFSESELEELISKGLKTGEIAKKLNRKYSSVACKISSMRKKGVLPPKNYPPR